MIEVAALTSGRTAPASRFRVRQHAGALLEQGVRVREFVPAIEKYADLPRVKALGKRRLGVRAVYAGLTAAKLACKAPGIVGSWKADVTWLERELLAARRTLEGLLGRPYVLDLDDAVWLDHRLGLEGMRRTIADAALIFAGNQHIADFVSSYNAHVDLVPTAVDCSRFVPAPPDPGPFALGWTGSSSNFPYLASIEQAIGAFLRGKDAVLTVVADREPTLPSIPLAQLRFVRWSEAIEAPSVQRMHVGLAPLVDNEWTRGKCGLKILQYLACERPTITSPVGANLAIVDGRGVGLVASSQSDWIEAMEALYADRALATRMGRAGRKLVLAEYSVDAISVRIAQAFRRVTRP